jgi:hypothetical protein
MPNPSNTPNQFPQNGRGPSDRNDRNGHGASSITLDAAITNHPVHRIYNMGSVRNGLL